MNRQNAVIFSTRLYSTLEQYGNRFPANCVLEQRQDNNTTFVAVTFTCDNGHAGHIILEDPNFTNGRAAHAQPRIGYVSMSCSIDLSNGYFLELCVENIGQMFEVIEFCQQLLQYQPDIDTDIEYLEYVRVPILLQDHWCVTPRLRELQNIDKNI